MKTIIFFFLAFSNFSFSHEMTLKQVKEDKKKAEAELKKLCSKRDVICKRGRYVQAGSQNQQPFGRARAEKQAQNEWGRVCRKSNNPSIQQARNKLNDIRQKINKMKQETVIGQNYTKLQNEWDTGAYSTGTQEGREFLKLLADAKDDWFALSRGLDKERLKAWDALYGDDGVCKKNTPDPDVYRAYEKWQAIKGKCEKAELACISKETEVRELISAEHSMMRQEDQDDSESQTSEGSKGVQ